MYIISTKSRVLIKANTQMDHNGPTISQMVGRLKAINDCQSSNVELLHCGVHHLDQQLGILLQFGKENRRPFVEIKKYQLKIDRLI